MESEINKAHQQAELIKQVKATESMVFWIETDAQGRKRINAPILAAAVMDERADLYKNSEGVFDSSGKRYADSDLEQILRDMVLLRLPTVSMDVIHKTCLPALIDRIPDKTIEINNDGVSSYISQHMAEEIIEYAKAGNISTGFVDLDKKSGGLFPGLYCIGAISSLGKTTLVHQMADQIALAGKHVLFFSLEMSRLEMVSKSIARVSAQLDRPNAIDSLRIRNGITNKLTAQAVQMYKNGVGDRMNIIEGSFDTTVAYIGEYARRYVEAHHEAPVIIVDYLQVISGAPKGTTKEATDYNIVELKRLSRSLKTPVIVISSVNRTNYLTPVDFESFKESGSIEFTADVVLGMQLTCMDEPLFTSEKDIVRKRERVRAAKAEQPRKVTLVCLKNRYGRTDWKVNFSYYSNHDLLIEEDGWTEVTNQETDNPFI